MTAAKWAEKWVFAGLAVLTCGAVAGADVAVFKEAAAAPIIGGTYTGAEDVMLVNNAGGATDQNFGGRADFEVGEVPAGPLELRHTLMRFDVSPLAGRFAIIDGVTLRLYPTVVQSTTPDALQVFRLSNSNTGWVEGTGVTAGIADPPDNGQSTWLARVQGSATWAGSFGASVPGLDYSELLGSATFSNATGIGGSNPLDVVLNPALVNSMVSAWAGGSNSGLFLRTGTESEQNIAFSSAEASNPALHPELIVTYRTEIPEPSAGALAWAAAMILGIRRSRR
jgi:hypothetical protein